jgi:O-antigen/teichoic acid export membrane protein
MSEKKRVAAGAGLVSLGRMIGSVTNLVTMMTLTRLLDKSAFSTMAFFYLLLNALALFGAIGLPKALVYYLARLDRSASRPLALWTGVCLLGLAVPMALILGGVGLTIGHLGGDQEYQTALFFLSAAVLFELPGKALPHCFLAEEKYRAWFGAQTGFFVGRFIAVVVPAALGAGPHTLLSLLVVVSATRFVGYVGYVLFGMKGGWRPRGWKLRKLFAYGAPLSVASGVNRLNREVDKGFVAVLTSPEIFAVYAVGAIQLPFVSGLASSVTVAMLPALVRHYTRSEIDSFMDYVYGLISKMAALMMPLFFFLMLMAEPVVKLLFSDSYASAALPFRIYLFILPLRLGGFGAIIRAMGETRPQMYATVTTLLVAVALNYPLFLALGVAGPALSSMIGQLVGMLWMLSIIRKRLDVPWSQVAPFQNIGKAALVALISLAPTAFVYWLVPTDALKVAVGLAVYGATYITIAYRTGVIPASDWRYLRDLMTFRFLKSDRQSG